ncbi:hypothetical protein CH370_01540 [Leptospira kmetyi]|nr:hypothetical protein CH370_01540 [Leptospira kmetyi]
MGARAGSGNKSGPFRVGKEFVSKPCFTRVSRRRGNPLFLGNSKLETELLCKEDSNAFGQIPCL